MKRALLVAGLGLSGVFAGMVACVGSSFVETGSGGKGSTGGGGAGTTQSSSSSGTTTATTTTTTTTTSTTTTTTTTSTSSGNTQPCPPQGGPAPPQDGSCNVAPSQTCGPYTGGTDPCCSGVEAQCVQHQWMLTSIQCISGSTCPTDLSGLNGQSCQCYNDGLMCGMPCNGAQLTRHVTTCHQKVWVTTTAPCPAQIQCNGDTCNFPDKVCVTTLLGNNDGGIFGDGGANTGSQSCVDNNCGDSQPLSCSCVGDVCPAGSACSVVGDQISCL